MANYSRQREIIYDILKCTDCHPTADWIYQNAIKVLPTISLGTVYRNLLILEQENKVIKVSRTDGKDRYDANIYPHAHLQCIHCGKIKDVNLSCNLQKEIEDFAKINAATAYSLKLEYVCEDCKDKI